MAIYETNLKSRQDVARGTTAFFFEKPEGFSFEPGQTLSLTLPNPEGDAEHPTQKHTFSIISAPFEHHVGIATRMRDSAFKRELAKLQPGSPVRFSGPYGKLTLPAGAERPIVLIAGGIGITPYISMLHQATHDKLAHKLLLLYANHRPEDAAFMDLLQSQAMENPNFRMLTFMTAPDTAGGPQRLDGPAIREAAVGLDNPIYYVTGSPAMIEGVTDTLRELGAADDAIMSEGFYGY